MRLLSNARVLVLGATLSMTALAAPPTGSLDHVDEKTISGWAADPDHAGPVEVHVYVDGALMKKLTASAPLGGAPPRGGAEARAFTWTPMPFGHGTHEVTAFAIGVDGTGEPDGDDALLPGGPHFIAAGCYGLSGSAKEWCVGLDEYWLNRQQDTEFVGNDLVRAGVNRSYGGTIFLLYGADWDTNVVLEHGGGAVQLSIWGYDESGKHASDGVRYKPCGGWQNTSPWNPIQAQAENCYWIGETNDVAEARWIGDAYYTRHDFPYHFTSTQPAPPMTMEQWVTAHEGYIEVAYRLTYTGEESWTIHPQEIPAIFSANEMRAHYYYYDGDAPFTDDAVTHKAGPPHDYLRFPGHETYAHGDKYIGYAREGWLTVCDESQERCLTVAAFDPIMNEYAVDDNKASEGYITALGHFKVEPGMDRQWKIYLFPYRHDEVIAGKTVRQRIAELATDEFRKRTGAPASSTSKGTNMTFPPLSDELRTARLAPPSGKVRMVLDTDTYNEIDDQFAVVYAMLSKEHMDVEAIYAAPFHNSRSEGPGDGMEKSYEEIVRILGHLGVSPEGLAHRGSTGFLKDWQHPYASPAALDLIQRAKSAGDEPLYVVAIGAITNVASAILLEPSIIEQIVVVWLGGHPQHWPDTMEFNLKQDPEATRVVLDSGVPLVRIPCMGVASHLLTTLPEMERHLQGQGAIGDYLVSIFKDYHKDHYAWAKVIWDISAVAWLINDRWVPSSTIPSPILNDDITWTTDASRHLVREAIYVSRNGVFKDLFTKIALANKKAS